MMPKQIPTQKQIDKIYDDLLDVYSLRATIVGYPKKQEVYRAAITALNHCAQNSANIGDLRLRNLTILMGKTMGFSVREYNDSIKVIAGLKRTTEKVKVNYSPDEFNELGINVFTRAKDVIKSKFPDLADLKKIVTGTIAQDKLIANKLDYLKAAFSILMHNSATPEDQEQLRNAINNIVSDLSKRNTLVLNLDDFKLINTIKQHNLLSAKTQALYSKYCKGYYLFTVPEENYHIYKNLNSDDIEIICNQAGLITKLQNIKDNNANNILEKIIDSILSSCFNQSSKNKKRENFYKNILLQLATAPLEAKKINFNPWFNTAKIFSFLSGVILALATAIGAAIAGLIFLGPGGFFIGITTGAFAMIVTIPAYSAISFALFTIGSIPYFIMKFINKANSTNNIKSQTDNIISQALIGNDSTIVAFLNNFLNDVTKYTNKSFNNKTIKFIIISILDKVTDNNQKLEHQLANIILNCLTLGVYDEKVSSKINEVLKANELQPADLYDKVIDSYPDHMSSELVTNLQSIMRNLMSLNEACKANRDLRINASKLMRDIQDEMKSFNPQSKKSVCGLLAIFTILDKDTFAKNLNKIDSDKITGIFNDVEKIKTNLNKLQTGLPNTAKNTKSRQAVRTQKRTSILTKQKSESSIRSSSQRNTPNDKKLRRTKSESSLPKRTRTNKKRLS